MGRGRRRFARAPALGLALALLIPLASAAGAGVSALGEKRITLAMEASIPASEPLVADDALRLDVTAAADFPAYSNSTVIYYDSRYFAPCDAVGTDFTAAVQGEGIGGYLELDASNPLCRAGPAFGDVNVMNLANYPAAWKDNTGALLPEYAHYAAVALKVPHEPSLTPGVGRPDAEMPWFTFYLKAALATPTDTQASIFMSQEAVRTAENRSAVMYYSASSGGAGWLDVDVALPGRLDYTIEAAAANPVTVNFTAAGRGALTGGITSVRNIEQGTTIAQQQLLRWPGTQADTGFYLAGWAYAGDHEQGVLPLDTPLGTVGGVYAREINLVAVFRNRPVRVQPYLLDLSRPAGSQEVPLGDPLDIRVADDYSANLAALSPALDAHPVDEAGGWFLERFGPAQANNYYTVPETDDETLPVEIARVHRGTWFVAYLAGGGDVAGLPGRQAKSAGETVSIAPGPTRRGYAFLHWTDGASDYSPGQGYSADVDLTLTAVWRQNPAPAVEGGASRPLQYKSTATLRLVTSAPGLPAWSSGNPGVVSVNAGSGEIRGVKTGTAVITGRDGEGFTANVTVTVSYAWWQWLIVILLFGWIWY